MSTFPFDTEGTGDMREIQRALKLLNYRGGIMELRVLKTKKGTVSGYFDSEHLYSLAKWGCHLSGNAPAVYVTLNPVVKDLLARCANSAQWFAKDTTANENTERRCWILIDFDPKRISGISSTDAQHESAIERAKNCRDWLRSTGILCIVLADSGNGAHLLIPVDLPNDKDATELVTRFLRAVQARFNDDAVEVDPSVSKAAQLTKLYGTMACKGSNLPDRPHRMSRILEEPERLEPVPREIIASVAGAAKADKDKAAAPITKTDGDNLFDEIMRPQRKKLDLKQWLDARKVQVVGEKDWHGGKLYVIGVCPWNADHTNGCVYAIQFADGGIMAKCFHKTCEGKGWPEFRDAIEPGWRENPDELMPLEDINDPDRLARMCLADLWLHERGWTLRRRHEAWFRWDGQVYREWTEEELESVLLTRIKEEFDQASIDAQIRNRRKAPEDRDKGAMACTVTGGLLANVKLAIQGRVIIRSELEMPCWLDSQAEIKADEILVATNGLFHLPTLADGKHDPLPLTPSYFTTFGLNYPVLQDVAKPERWLTFLGDVFPDDKEARDTLQEWMGYILTQDTRQHKMLMMIGPTRSGKGTVGRIMGFMIGIHNVAAQQMASLRGDFGLAPLLGKYLLIISDARIQGKTDIVLERLLSITGEDLMTVNRKNQPAITVKLMSRVVIQSNELPKLDDASGAIVNRMIMLRFTRSFLGRENPKLTDELKAELPGILMWAIEGWKRLQQRGYFVQPKSGQALFRQMEELASPIKAFVDECCVINGAATVTHDNLYNAYLKWCEKTGRLYPDPANVFGKNLRAAYVWISDSQPEVDGKRVRYYVGIGLK